VVHANACREENNEEVDNGVSPTFSHHSERESERAQLLRSVGFAHEITVLQSASMPASLRAQLSNSGGHLLARADHGVCSVAWQE
jgi:hypothetical protein